MRAAVSRVETFGLTDEADWQAYDIEPLAAAPVSVCARRAEPRRLRGLPLPGLTTCGTRWRRSPSAPTLGVDVRDLRSGLAGVPGVRRDGWKCAATPDGVTVFDDFAHHPTAVGETLRASTRVSGRRMWAVFEPRSASSCRRMFQGDFARAFAGADEIIMAAVFRSTMPDEDACPERLVDRLRAAGHHARYVPHVADIVETIAREARPGDLVVLMSNGGFDNIHDKLLAALAAGER